MSPALAPVSYVDLSTSSSEEEEEGCEEEENVPEKDRRRVHRELRSVNEGRQTRQSLKSEPQILQGSLPLFCCFWNDMHNCFLTESAASKREVESEEEEWEEQTKQERRLRAHPPKSRPQQEETGERLNGHPSLESSRREEVAPLVRRSPRKKGLSVAEFAKQVQDGGQAKKQTIKLAGRVLDPHAMSSSKESDASYSTQTESSATHTVRRSPRKHSTPTTQNHASPQKSLWTPPATGDQDEGGGSKYPKQHKLPNRQPKGNGYRAYDTSGPSRVTSGPSRVTRSSTYGSSMEAASALTRNQRSRPTRTSADIAAQLVEVDSSDSEPSVKRRKVSPDVKKEAARIRRSDPNTRQELARGVLDPPVLSSSEESDLNDNTDTERNASNTKSNFSLTVKHNLRKHYASTQRRVSPRKHPKTATATDVAEEEEDEYQQHSKVPRRQLRESSKRVSGNSRPSRTVRSSAVGRSMESTGVVSAGLSTLIVEVDSLGLQMSDNRRQVTQKRGTQMKKKHNEAGNVVAPYLTSTSKESESEAALALPHRQRGRPASRRHAADHGTR